MTTQSYRLAQGITVLPAVTKFEADGAESVVQLLRQASHALWQQTRTAPQLAELWTSPPVATLWVSPRHLMYLSVTRVANTLDFTLLQFILENSPTITTVSEQPVLEGLGAERRDVMVVFHPEAVERPECIGWLVGAAALYYPKGIIVLEGV